MKKNITITLLLLVIIGGGYFLYKQNNNGVTNTVVKEEDNVEKMDITVYVNDEAGSSEFLDCAVNKKITVQVPKGESITDASLKFLFSGELSKYGVYQSVEIASGTAKVMLASDMTPSGYPISGLSSCQTQNMLSVLKDTLTQDSNIKSVKLFSPKGEIVF